jgi:hypothetical protein
MSDSDTSYVDFCQCAENMECKFDQELKIWYCFPQKDNYHYRIYYDNKKKKTIISICEEEWKILNN